MRLVEPKIFLIGETRIINEEMQLYLDELGISDWTSDAPTDAEKIIEIMGRLCYRSWRPGMNPNVVKIRKHNKEYIDNIIETKHGSVLEHVMLNFIISDVSRVFTHELVRHRVGVAISQESLRFVRLDELRFCIPLVFRNHPKSDQLMRFTVEKVELMEQWQQELAEILEIDNETSFAVKKKLTSAMRRLAPDGLATSIGWSVDAREIRHIIEMRTHPSSEEEIRLVFGKIAEKVKTRYPHIFADYAVEIVDDLPWYKTERTKV